MKKQSSNNSFVINRSTGISIGVIMLLLSPLIAAVVFIAVTNEKLKSLTSKVDDLNQVVKMQNSNIKSNIDKELKEIKTECQEQSDGNSARIDCLFRSKEQIEQRINSLSFNIKYMEGKLEENIKHRWTKEQDKAYMSIFASENNLKMPTHE